MTETSDKFIAMLGFAKRSGKIVYGLDNLKKAKGVKLMAVSGTASPNLLSEVEVLSDKTGLPVLYADRLEEIVGNNVKALGLTDANMVRAVISYAENSKKYKLRFGSRR